MEESAMPTSPSSLELPREEEDVVDDKVDDPNVVVPSRKRLRETEEEESVDPGANAMLPPPPREASTMEVSDPVNGLMEQEEEKAEAIHKVDDSTPNAAPMEVEEEENDRANPVDATTMDSTEASKVAESMDGNENTPPPLSITDPTEATPSTSSRPPLSTQSSSSSYESLRWVTVTNDGTAASMIRLIGLKSLFAKQLPKMPRAYIARLVLDRQHTSLAILASEDTADDAIVGGICYRTFPEQRFAEIAFCAVHATHQVKGYGTKLMNLLKQTAAKQGIEYFITYADNYAIGYFKKQGFTKQITMPKGRYFGLIKDYDGGTPMECYVHPSIDYYHIPELIEAQRNFILARIARTALSATTVYPPPHPSLSSDGSAAQSWTQDAMANASGGGGISVSRHHAIAAQALTIPGVLEAGWTLSDLIQSTNRTSEDMKQKSQALKQELLALLRKIEEQQCAWPFREPVDPADAPDYYDVIPHPIDLRTMTQRVRQDHHYKNKLMLYHDIQLMVENCKAYNEDGSIYIQCAVALEKYAQTLFHDVLQT